MQRIIIGGAARSGTTLVQAMLGATSAYFVFPESHYFSNLFLGKKNYLPRMLGGNQYRDYVLQRNLKAAGFDAAEIAASQGRGIGRFTRFLDEEGRPAAHGRLGGEDPRQHLVPGSHHGR